MLAARALSEGTSDSTPSSSSRRRNGWAHRSMPMPAGTRSARASRSRPTGWRRRSTWSQRSSCDRPFRRPRWSACGTSDSTTCSRPRPTPDGEPSRRSPTRSTPPASPYHRPSGGTRETVERLTAGDLRTAYERNLDPRRATLVIGGDLGGQDVTELAERLFGAWRGSGAGLGADDEAIVDTPAADHRIVRVVHRPGSVQTEIRIGHRGLPRRIPDFHAVSVMSAILGGLFNSRLNMKLREEKGYTYGAGAGFDLRRGAGPFAARAAVNTEVTVAATLDTLVELDRMRERAGHAERAQRRPRFPDRRLPAPVRDQRGGRRRRIRARRPRPAARRADRLSPPDRGRRRRGRRGRGPGASPRRHRRDRPGRRRGCLRRGARGRRPRPDRHRARRDRRALTAARTGGGDPGSGRS